MDSKPSFPPKLRRFFNALAFSFLLLTFFARLASFFSLSLGINQPQLNRAAFWLILFTALINRRQIVAFFNAHLANPKQRKKFLLLTGANLLLILGFLVGFAIFQYGSPLVYENHPKSFKAAKEVPLVQNTIISEEFRADSNNLGTVGIKLSVQEKILGFNEEGEIMEIIPPKEEEQEEAVEEALILSPAEIVFRLKEKGAENWFYENTYYFDQAAPSHLYPFGFPIIEESEGKTYLIELAGKKQPDEETPALYVFAATDSAGQPYLYPRYVYSKGELKNNIGPILENTLRKVSLIFRNQEAILILIVHLVLSSVLIAAFLRKKLFNVVLQYSFLAFLFLLSIHQFLPKVFPSYSWETSILKPYLAITTTVLGIILILKNKKRIEKDILEEEAREAKEKIKKANKFPKRFPLLAKIPILNSIFSWIYSQGLWSIIGLLVILTIFTIVKAPYFDTSFTGEHTMKYNTYVEPAKYMYEKNNPFWMQRKYQSDPVNNPQGIFKNFGSLPLNEWGLFLTYKAFPNNSIEVNTRIFTHFLGLLILIFAYIFFSKWLSKRESLLITFLMSINPIINFISFVTVADSWLIIFTFLTLIYLTKYLKKEKSIDLFLSGVFFGLGNICKYSIFLWLFPIILLITYLVKRNPNKIIKTVSIITFISLAIIIAFKTSLSQLPNSVLPSFLKFIFWVFIFIIFYLLLKKFNKQIENGIECLLNRKTLLFFVATVMLIFLSIFIHVNNLNNFSTEFLTDSTLIFNWKMYAHMLRQFKAYMTNHIFWLGLLGLLFTLIAGSKKQKILLLSFLFGSFVYWIAASKPMFFHNYYTAIIMISFCVSSAFLLYIISKIINNKLLSTIFLAVILVIISLSSYSANVNRLKKEEDKNSFNEACKYLTENTSEDESYIDGSYTLTLTIYSGRPAIDRSFLENESIRKSVEDVGLIETMKNFKIKYLITKNEEINYLWFANLYSPDFQEIALRRSDLILEKLENIPFFEDEEEREKIITEKNIKSQIMLEKEIGPYKFYLFYQ